MNEYYSHTTALLHWKVPYSWVVFGFRTEEEMRSKAITHISYTSRDNHRNANRNTRYHLGSDNLTKRAIVKCGDIYVSSPELVFVEMAQVLPFERLVLLGLLLCGSDVSRNAKAVTSAHRIKSFLASIGRVHGKKKALAAVTYLTDEAASAHEAILYMLLCLPPRLGGYGFPAASFNVKIDVPKEYVRVTERKYFLTDLYWSKEKLVIEYDSKAHHDNEGSWVKDAAKGEVLRAMGYTVESVNTTQLYSKASFEVCAGVIAEALGWRPRIDTPKFETNHSKIRALLPG